MLSIMYKNKKCCEPIKGKLIEWFTVLTGLGEGAYYHLQYLIYSQTLSLKKSKLCLMTFYWHMKTC